MPNEGQALPNFNNSFNLSTHQATDYFLDFPRAGVSRFFRRVVYARVEAELLHRLLALAEREKLSSLAVLLGGFGFFVARHTRSEHFPIGWLVKPNALSITWLSTADDPKVIALFRNVDRQLQHVRSDWPQAPRILFAAPEFSPGASPDRDGIVWRNSDMAVLARREAGGLILECEYDEDLFDAAHLCQRFARLPGFLRCLTENPHRSAWEVPVLTPEEAAAALANGNDTETSFPPAKPLHRLFEEQVQITPDRDAIRWFDADAGERRSSTYDQLNRRANRLAHRLLKAGVERGDIVGLHAQRSPAVVIGMLAILKAGGAYLPLDPAYPAARLELMLGDSQAGVLLCDDTSTTITGSLPGQVLSLSDAPGSDENPNVHVEPGDNFCIIYTSGSTGRPKGVTNQHRSTMNCFEWMWRALPFKSTDVCCTTTSPCFGDSIQEVFGPLLRGVPLEIVPESTVKSPHALVRLLEEMGVTRIVLVPSLLRVLLVPSLEISKRLSQLRIWVCSGEALPAELARQFLVRMPHARLINLYGASEMSNDVTWQELRLEHLTGLSAPMGWPVDQIRVYLLDRAGHPVPEGASGEMYVAGDGLTGGYLYNAEATAERFLRGDKLPTSLAGREEVVYRTGDLARRRIDGSLEFLGRTDQQVKLRGYRIELGEIEATLKQYPGVCEAVVVMSRSMSEEEAWLAAFVVPASVEGAPPASDLKALLQKQLRSQLPDYMIPTIVRLEPELPRLPSGKVDRRALTTLPQTPDRCLENEEPKTETERKLARLWTNVLGVEVPGRKETFADLGGHSLAAAILLVRVRTEFGVELTVCDLAEAQTLAAQATLIEASQDGNAVTCRVAGHVGQE